MKESRQMDFLVLSVSPLFKILWWFPMAHRSHGPSPSVREHGLAHKALHHLTPAFFSKPHVSLLSSRPLTVVAEHALLPHTSLLFDEDVPSACTSLPLSVHLLWPSSSLSSSVRYFLTPLPWLTSLFYPPHNTLLRYPPHNTLFRNWYHFLFFFF